MIGINFDIRPNNINIDYNSKSNNIEKYSDAFLYILLSSFFNKDTLCYARSYLSDLLFVVDYNDKLVIKKLLNFFNFYYSYITQNDYLRISRHPLTKTEKFDQCISILKKYYSGKYLSGICSFEKFINMKKYCTDIIQNPQKAMFEVFGNNFSDFNLILKNLNI